MEPKFFYIIFSLMVISTALSLTFFMAWKNFGKKAHALTWSIGFLAGAAQWLCMINYDQFPTRESYLLLENAFSMALVALGLRGHCQRTNCKWLPKNLWPYVIPIYGVIAFNILVLPNVGIRMAVVPTFAAITLAASAYMILKYREHTRPAEYAVATSLIVFAAIQIGDASLAFMQGPAGNESIAAAYMHFNFLTLPACYVATSMLIILMMASDISAKLKMMAVHDELTGLLNRRGFTEYGERAFANARRMGQPLSVVMTDIDRFKYINDKYGHAAGDTALIHFAKLFSATHRQEDVIARVGGEEFALLLPGTDLRDAMAMADQLCERIGSTPIDMTTIGLPMTSSFGVAAISDKDKSLDDMVLRADRALYRSKRAGRNQVDLESSQLMRRNDGTLVPVSSG